MFINIACILGRKETIPGVIPRKPPHTIVLIYKPEIHLFPGKTLVNFFPQGISEGIPFQVHTLRLKNAASPFPFMLDCYADLPLLDCPIFKYYKKAFFLQQGKCLSCIIHNLRGAGCTFAAINRRAAGVAAPTRAGTETSPYPAGGACPAPTACIFIVWCRHLQGAACRSIPRFLCYRPPQTPPPLLFLPGVLPRKGPFSLPA